MRIGRATLHRIIQHQVRLAGPRYAPGLDPAAPNLAIQSLTEAFDALGMTPAFRDRVRRLADALRKEWPRARSGRLGLVFEGRRRTPERLLAGLTALAEAMPSQVRKVVAGLSTTTRHLLVRVRGELGAIQTEHAAAPAGDPRRRELEEQQSLALRLLSDVDDVSEFLKSQAGQVVVKKAALLLGGWGTGKTHTLCDLAQTRRGLGRSTLLILSHALPPGDPRETLPRSHGLAASLTALLRALDRLGRLEGGRALLLVDAINEGDRRRWRSALAPLCRTADQYPHVGLVVSCRTPFDRDLVRPRTRRLLLELHHPGFEEQEADAQRVFFDFYGIPTPPHPLIVPEFSRPFFLRLFCEAITKLSRERKELFLGQVITGHVGMTTILERVVKTVGRPIENALSLPQGLCWRVLKGDQVTGQIVGVAPAMADSQQEHLPRSACLEILRAHLRPIRRTRQAERLLQRLIADSLLLEVPWWPATEESRITFPYQRFGEQLIARHLLARHLRTTSEAAVRRCFYRHRPLGKLFTARHDWAYDMAGVAAAIMLEFPQHTRRCLPRNARELAFYLPKHRQPWRPVVGPFLESLPWREADSFTAQTQRLISLVLERGSEEEQRSAYEVLVETGCRVGHPLSGDRLWRYLEAKPMWQRDLQWSELLRATNKNSAIIRLLNWCEANPTAAIAPDAAEAVARMLALGLTTTVRPLRDRFTRALFQLGLRLPAALFERTLAALSFNDPYVPERLLAASYGVAMCQHAAPQNDRLRAALPDLARRLVEEMYVPPAPHQTTHTLVNGYALGLVELAEKIGPGSVPRHWQRHVRPPLTQMRSPFRDPTVITDAECQAVEQAIHMDFGNYTMGSLIPGRANYEDTHPEYVKVRRQVLGRMHDLGYSTARFGALDRLIGQSSWRESNDGQKSDRYGKKYSWIGYFEMYGLRQHLGLLDEDEIARSADCGVDPSFPEPPPTWSPRLPDVFAEQPTNLVEWMRRGPAPLYEGLRERASVDGECGPWVALSAFVEREQPGDNRAVRTFIRSYLVRARAAASITRTFMTAEYPGNTVYRGPDDVYTYGGEVPWSQQFGHTLRTRWGHARRKLEAVTWKSRVNAEIPVHEVLWESHHSTLNKAGTVLYVSPALCEALRLQKHGQSCDLFDARQRLATLHRIWRDKPGAYFRSDILYLRRDLLRRYLRKTQQALLWVTWGERLPTADQYDRLRDDDVSAVRASHDDTYRHVAILRGGSGPRVSP